MKRPLTYIGFSYLFILILLFFTGRLVSLTIIILSAVLFILSLFKTPFNKPIYTLCFLALIVASLQYTFFVTADYENILTLDKKTVSVSGEILESMGKGYGNNYYALKITGNSDKGVNRDFKVRLTVKENIEFSPGDRIKTTVKLSVPPEKYGLNSKMSNLSNKIYLYATPLDPPIKTGEKFNFYRYAVILRKTAENIFDSNLNDDSASLLKAMILGDGDSLETEVYNNFKSSGALHILVVSGMHISIIMGFCLVIFDKLRIKPHISCLITIPIIFVFIAVTGFGVSSLRAGIMGAVYLLSRVFMKQGDSLNSLSLSVLILTIVNPFNAVNLSFLLSVFATLGIILFAEPMAKRLTVNFSKRSLRELSSKIALIVSQSLSANIFILPISVMFIGSLSLTFPITNLLLVPISTLFMLLGFIFLAVAGVGIPILTPVLKFIIELICDYHLFVVKILGQSDRVLLNLNNDTYKILLAIFFILAGIYLLLLKKKNVTKIFIAVSVVLFVLTCTASGIMTKSTVNLTVLDVENGVSVLLQSGDNFTVIGCGGNGLSNIAVKNKLEENGRDKTDLFILPNNSFAFSSKAENLLKSVPTKKIILPKDNSTSEYEKFGKYSDIAYEDTISLENDVEIELYKVGKSLVVVIERNQSRVAILSGAPFGDTLKNLNADLIITPYASYVNGISSCDTVILSAGEKLSKLEGNKLKEQGFNVISTAENGDIKLTFKEKKILINL